jgi:hypothetical protein
MDAIQSRAFVSVAKSLQVSMMQHHMTEWYLTDVNLQFPKSHPPATPHVAGYLER